MSHPQQMQWVASVRERFPDAFTRKRVLEIGSRNINGTVRDFFTDCAYIGVDVAAGPGVDLVCPLGFADWWVAEKLAEADFDYRIGRHETIISAECLEHDMHWQATLAAAVDALEPGGHLILTCAGPGRQEHGTRRTSPQDAPGLPWPDYYRNLSEADLRSALDLTQFSAYEFSLCLAPSDTYFWGVKHG